jgi:isorenieratene synthase
VNPLLEHIQVKEGLVMLGARVERLECVDGGWWIIVNDARRGRRSLLAEQVILAVDAPAARQILTASPDTAELAKSMCFPKALRNAVVRIWYDSQPYTTMPGGMFTGDFEVDNFFWLDRLRPDFKEWAREVGGSCLEMHLYATEQVLDQADEILIDIAATEAHRTFPEMKGHIVHAAVRRNEPTQTVFRPPTRDSLWVETPWEGINACGDWIGAKTSAMQMERSVITGIMAANRVIAAHGLEPFEIIPDRKSEELVRVLGGVAWVLRRTLGRGMYIVARMMRRKSPATKAPSST